MTNWMNGTGVADEAAEDLYREVMKRLRDLPSGTKERLREKLLLDDDNERYRVIVTYADGYVIDTWSKEATIRSLSTFPSYVINRGQDIATIEFKRQ